MDELYYNGRPTKETKWGNIQLSHQILKRRGWNDEITSWKIKSLDESGITAQYIQYLTLVASQNNCCAPLYFPYLNRLTQKLCCFENITPKNIWKIRKRQKRFTIRILIRFGHGGSDSYNTGASSKLLQPEEGWVSKFNWPSKTVRSSTLSQIKADPQEAWCRLQGFHYVLKTKRTGET